MTTMSPHGLRGMGMAEIDFTQFECVGAGCFGLAVHQRGKCTAEKHPCPFHSTPEINASWLCRCCPDCQKACEKENEDGA